MSMNPFILDNYTRPSGIFDMDYCHPGDFLSSVVDPGYIWRSRMNNPVGYIRPWRTEHSRRDVGSTVAVDKDKFQANLDVQQFKPEEITVKASGENTLTIEGKHEEKQDEHGFISRHFVRRYVLPKSCDFSKVESKLSSDGVLTITAPVIKSDETEHKTIPIIKTGQPAKIDQKKNEKKEECKK